MRARRALFVTYGAGHIAMVAPVIRELQRREPGIHIDLLALTTGAHAARAMGFAPLGYRDFVHWYNADTLQKHAAPVLADTRHPMIDEKETVAYLGINFEDLHQQLGAQAAAQAYAAKGRWAFMPLNFMRRLLDHLKPDVVVTTNSPRTEEASIAVAAEMDIPSVCMVDLFSPVGDPFLNRTVYADALTTISELGKRNLVAGGVQAERIHITGSPAFDSLTDPLPIKQAADDRARLGWQQLKVVLWPGHLELLPESMSKVDDPAKFPKDAERMLRNYVATNLHTALVVRYHPNHVAHFAADKKQDRVLWSDASTRHVHRDIHLCDVAVVQATTVGLEAAIAGKSVISLDHSPSRAVFPCSQQGISRGIESFAELPGALHAAFAHPFQSGIASSAGDAAKKVVTVIEQTVKMKTLPSTSRS